MEAGIYEDEDGEQRGDGLDLIPRRKDPWHNFLDAFKGGFCPAPPHTKRTDNSPLATAPVMRSRPNIEAGVPVLEGHSNSPDRSQSSSQGNEWNVLDSDSDGEVPTWDDRPRDYSVTESSRPSENRSLPNDCRGKVVSLRKGSVAVKTRYASVIEGMWGALILLILITRILHHLGISYLTKWRHVDNKSITAFRKFLGLVPIAVLMMGLRLLRSGSEKSVVGPESKGRSQKKRSKSKMKKAFSVQISGKWVRGLIENMFASFVLVLLGGLIIFHLHLKVDLSMLRHLKTPMVPEIGVFIAIVSFAWLASCAFAMGSKRVSNKNRLLGGGNDACVLRSTQTSTSGNDMGKEQKTDITLKLPRRKQQKRFIGAFSEGQISCAFELCWAFLLVLVLGVVIVHHLGFGSYFSM